MPIVDFQGQSPRIHPSVFIAPDAWIIGDVEIGEGSSVFFGAVLRGDINPIRVGKGSNIQEHALMHTSRGLGPCLIENEVTIGHGAVLHGCHVKSRALIGMQATVLDESIIEEDAVVAAHALVKMGTLVPSFRVAAGVPAEVKGEVSASVREFTESGVSHYRHLAIEYKKLLGS
jgi:carbonic anhydrase/acetyltransferase-like protein (isoleucine patch superfamily)